MARSQLDLRVVGALSRFGARRVPHLARIEIVKPPEDSGIVELGHDDVSCWCGLVVFQGNFDVARMGHAHRRLERSSATMECGLHNRRDARTGCCGIL